MTSMENTRRNCLRDSRQMKMHITKDKINEEKASVKMLNWKSKWDSWTVISVYALSQQQLHILHLPTLLQPNHNHIYIPQSVRLRALRNESSLFFFVHDKIF